MTARRVSIILGSVVVAYLATGIVVIPRDEVGVVRRFGQTLQGTWPPGAHYGLPWGIDRVDRLDLDRERSLTVGSLTGESEDYLTGDLNLVRVRARVHYRVASPGDFLFGSASAADALAAIAESSLTRIVAARRGDELLSAGRIEAADRMRREIQGVAESQGLGLSVHEVRLVSVAPIEAVAPAFAEAGRAIAERRQALNRAESYRVETLADARSRVRETVNRASGRVEGLLQMARGEAERFETLAREVAKNPGPSRQKLYRDAMAEILPKFERIYVVAPGEDVDLNVLPRR